MELLLLLLTSHFIASFYLQPAHWIAGKSTHNIKSLRLWMYVGVHTLLNILVFVVSDITLLPAVIAIVLISLAHMVSSYWLSSYNNNLRYFLILQSLHLVLLGVIWITLTQVSIVQISHFIAGFFNAKNMLIAIAYLLVCKPASVVISLALKPHTDNLTQHIHRQTKYAEDKENKNVGLVSAGAWIGYIERCLAISFIFMGQFAGIGFLVATKTIFRFGDLTNNKDMKLTEYMMLGTMLSYAIALFIGWNTLQIYKFL